MNAAPTLEMLDPTTLIVDINVRKDAALTPEFIASIKEHGVMEPVIAHRKDDGTVHVLMGQRRTLRAIEAQRAEIPVMIINSPKEAERIVTQVVENIQRAELTEADEADAYHQLSLIGVSAAAIAKKTGRKKTTIEGALKAKASEAGAPVPALSSALAYFDSYRQGRGTSNLIQAQRDFFGAHGFERIGEQGAFHGPWGSGAGH